MSDTSTTKVNKCGIEACNHPVYDEGVCFFHYPLREAWGYNGGYELYMTHNRDVARKDFRKWIDNLTVQDVIDLYTEYDWKLAQDIVNSYNNSQPKVNEVEKQ